MFSIIGTLQNEARQRGEDIIDFGMGNPDKPPPQHIIDKLAEMTTQKDIHRYSVSKGIPRLRQAICHWYKERYQVELDPEDEAIVTLGSKEGLAHLCLTVADHGDMILVTSPAYPIHPFGFTIAGADVIHIPIITDDTFFDELERAVCECWPKPKMLVINFPNNPTTHCVDLDFFVKVIEFAKQKKIWVVQDLAYADIVFDGYKAPSILQVPGAKEVAVEFFSLSKSYNMPGWRVGFMVGNKQLVAALGRIKSYLDYGIFTPIQMASVAALESDYHHVESIAEMYRLRRDAFCDGLEKIGWSIEKPKATMFVWAKIPDQFSKNGSLEFSKNLLRHANVAVSPGIGFGTYGEGYVRIALIEDEKRIEQAISNIGNYFERAG